MMTCVAVDDEAMALNVLENYISKVPFLTHRGSFTDALKAMDFLNNHDVDLLFLDINMPDISGIQLLKSLKKAPKVIFTTAYAHYAVESYEYEAADYLLKPIHFDRFLKAVNRVQANLQSPEPKADVVAEKTPAPNVIFIKSGTSQVKIKLSEIFFIEATGNYVTLMLMNEKIMSLVTMGEMLEMLPEHQFTRIHKSFIVSLDKVRSFDRNMVKIGKVELPLSTTFRDEFLKKIQEM